MNKDEAKQFRERIFAAIKAAVAEAIEQHRKAGRSIPIWRDGKVIHVPPEQIKPIGEQR